MDGSASFSQCRNGPLRADFLAPEQDAKILRNADTFASSRRISQKGRTKETGGLYAWGVFILMSITIAYFFSHSVQL